MSFLFIGKKKEVEKEVKWVKEKIEQRGAAANCEEKWILNDVKTILIPNKTGRGTSVIYTAG